MSVITRRYTVRKIRGNFSYYSLHCAGHMWGHYIGEVLSYCSSGALRYYSATWKISTNADGWVDQDGTLFDEMLAVVYHGGKGAGLQPPPGSESNDQVVQDGVLF